MATDAAPPVSTPSASAQAGLSRLQARLPAPGVLGAAAAFLITLVHATLALCPSGWWLDSSEFAAATAVLGVAHPPGHPVALLWGRLFSLLPIGPIALRVGFGQAVASALSAACLTAIGARLGRRLLATLPRQPAPLVIDALSAALALCATLAVVLGYGVAFQGVRPEVYALQGTLVLASTWQLLRYDEDGDRRGLYLGALLLGLGLANHHYLTGFSIPPILILLARERRDDERRSASLRAIFRTALPAIAAGLFGLLFYAYLPLRAARHPVANWGSPTDLSSFFWVVSAAVFRKALKAPSGDDADIIGGIVDQVHPLGMLFAAIGGYLLIRQQPTRRAGIFLSVAVVLCALARLGTGFDPANPDVYGYLIPSFTLLAVLAGQGAIGLCGIFFVTLKGRSARGLSIAVLVLAAALAGLRASSDYRRVSLARFYDLEDILGEDLRQAPPRAWLFSANFQTAFGLWYLQAVQGERPDVMHAHRHFLDNPGYRADLLRRYPDESGLPAALGPRDVDRAGVLKARALRPVLYEFDLETPDDLLHPLVPFGAFERIEIGGLSALALAPGGLPAVRTLAGQRRAADELRQSGDLRTKEVLLWRSFLGMNLSCRKGDGRRLGEEVLRTRRLLGGKKSPEVDALLASCGPRLGAGPRLYP